MLKIDEDTSRVEVHVDSSDCPQETRERYENDLILALARFGYSPYLAMDGGVAFTVDVTALTKADGI